MIANWTPNGYTNIAVPKIVPRTKPVDLVKRCTGTTEVIYTPGFRKPKVPKFTTNTQENISE